MASAMTRRILCTVAAGALVLFTNAAAFAGFNFSDITHWVGSGANQAALVIDWSDGKTPESLAWGYRWDGSATAEDMVSAIAGTTEVRVRGDKAVDGLGDASTFLETRSGADPRLYARMSAFSFGNTLFGIGYDLDGDGGGFISGFETEPGETSTETGSANDADDHYAEGWESNPSWSGTSNTGDPFDGGSWSGFTFLGRTLSDGDWDGWSIGSGTGPALPVAAAPEPTSAVVLGVVSIAMILRRRGRC
jgi:hypothetical protein